jgi:hypothetical protein
MYILYPLHRQDEILVETSTCLQFYTGLIAYCTMRIAQDMDTCTCVWRVHVLYVLCLYFEYFVIFKGTSDQLTEIQRHTYFFIKFYLMLNETNNFHTCCLSNVSASRLRVTCFRGMQFVRFAVQGSSVGTDPNALHA